MTLLNSQFDVISHDPLKTARAGLMTVLAVDGAGNPYSSLPASGTPIAGDIPSGTIVVMNSSGNAIVADNALATTHAPQMFFVTVDGDQDYDGAFVHRLTCIQGGCELQLDTANYVTGTYAPGDKLSCGTTGDAGLFRAAASGEQIYGMVGANGQDTTKYTLHVIIPQGISPALP